MAVFVVAFACMAFICRQALARSGVEWGFVKAVDSLNHYAVGCPGCAQSSSTPGRSFARSTWVRSVRPE